MGSPDLSGLQAEARLFGLYLTGGEPCPELTGRYARAVGCRGLSGEADRQFLDFSLRHPWSIGPLDAACAFLRPRSALRGRLLIFTAVLEASPWFTDRFLPPSTVGPGALIQVGLLGVRAVGKLGLGIPLFLFVKLSSPRGRNL